MGLFWTILILMICFAALFCFALLLLGVIMGRWAAVVLGALLAAGVVTVLVNAYKEVTDRLSRMEKTLDRLIHGMSEQVQEEPPAEP